MRQIMRCWMSLLLLVAVQTLAAPAPIDQVLHRSEVKSNEGEFLPPDQAFRLFAQPQGEDRIALTWEIAEGYYLYRNRLKIATDSPVKLGELVLPVGQSKTDEYFGTQQVYHNELRAIVPVVRSGTTPQSVPLRVTYQGCADAGLCYPPITKDISIALGTGTGSELHRPLGITIVGGLIVSQALTLFTTPVVYVYLDRLRMALSRDEEASVAGTGTAAPSPAHGD